MKGQKMYQLTKRDVDKICKDNGKLAKWKGSIFESLIMNYIPAERGKKVEPILSKILVDMGVDHKLMTDNSLGYDFIIYDKTVELKYASENEFGNFTFDQVRVEDVRYEYIIFMFVKPNECNFYCIKKEDLKYFTTNNQHSGQSNASTLCSTAYNMNLFTKSGDGTIEDVIGKISGNKEYKSIKTVLENESKYKKNKAFEIVDFIFNSTEKITYSRMKQVFKDNGYFSQIDIQKMTKFVKDCIKHGKCQESVCKLLDNEKIMDYK